MNTVHIAGSERLLKLVRISKSPEDFVNDILKFPKWYIQNDFLKKQTKAYFYQFYNDYKGRK